MVTHSAPAGLTLATGLLFTMALGAGALGLLHLTSLITDDSPGGHVVVQVFPRCTVVMLDRPCFEHANLTVEYPSGGNSSVMPMEEWMIVKETRVDLEQARATLIIQTDRGEWVREILIPEEDTHRVFITVDEPRSTGTVEGPRMWMMGYGILFTVTAILAAGVTAASAAWLFTGRLGPARASYLLLIIALVASWLLLLSAYFDLLLGIAAALVGCWVTLLIIMTRRWIKANETPGSEEDVVSPP